MDTKVKATAHLYDLNFLINISMQCRRSGQQVDKIPISHLVDTLLNTSSVSYVLREKKNGQRLQHDHELEP